MCCTTSSRLASGTRVRWVHGACVCVCVCTCVYVCVCVWVGGGGAITGCTCKPLHELEVCCQWFYVFLNVCEVVCILNDSLLGRSVQCHVCVVCDRWLCTRLLARWSTSRMSLPEKCSLLCQVMRQPTVSESV